MIIYKDKNHEGGLYYLQFDTYMVYELTWKVDNKAFSEVRVPNFDFAGRLAVVRCDAIPAQHVAAMLDAIYDCGYDAGYIEGQYD